MNPETGDTLYARNAGKLMVPASNMKIITGAVALAQLGPGYRWQTRIAARGDLVNGNLAGDLVIIGRGDPSLSDEMRGDAMRPMRELADSLRAAGVRRVTGRLIAGGNAFPDTTLGPGWEWDDLGERYGARFDELFWNDGLEKAVTTRAGRDTVVLVPGIDPTTAYLAALGTALGERRIAVDGGIAPASQRADTTGLRTLFTFLSPPLGEVIRFFGKESQNQIGEILIRTVGLEKTGVGSLDSGRVVFARQLVAWGIEPDGFFIHDGSGLSRHNLLSPGTIVRTLVAVKRSPFFGSFHASLPIAGVDGTLRTRMRGTPAAGNMRAKTGTLHQVRALGGYVTTAAGTELVFSLLFNNFTATSDEVAALRDSFGALLAGYDGPTR